METKTKNTGISIISMYGFKYCFAEWPIGKWEICSDKTIRKYKVIRFYKRGIENAVLLKYFILGMQYNVYIIEADFNKADIWDERIKSGTSDVFYELAKVYLETNHFKPKYIKYDHMPILYYVIQKYNNTGELHCSFSELNWLSFYYCPITEFLNILIKNKKIEIAKNQNELSYKLIIQNITEFEKNEATKFFFD